MVEVRYYLILSDDDYVEVTNNITTASKAYEDSVTALKQVTNPRNVLLSPKKDTKPDRELLYHKQIVNLPGYELKFLYVQKYFCSND